MCIYIYTHECVAMYECTYMYMLSIWFVMIWILVQTGKYIFSRPSRVGKKKSVTEEPPTIHPKDIDSSLFQSPNTSMHQ